MKLLHAILLCLAPCYVSLCAMNSPAAEAPGPEEQSRLAELSELSSSANPLTSVCMSFNALNTRIRDSKIDSSAARAEVKRLLALVRAEYYQEGGRDHESREWVFPLSGYDSRAIGGGPHHGYIPGTYDFYKGNRHGGHPSFDIFIHDRNQDALDDRTGRPVKVLSLTGGVVVAREREWQPGSRQLGGKYLWVYDPTSDLLVYYAHNAELSVNLGAIVRPGEVLATVGRSGYNAARRRSPTHLHLTVLRVRDGRVVPMDIYQDLKQARLLDLGQEPDPKSPQPE